MTMGRRFLIMAENPRAYNHGENKHKMQRLRDAVKKHPMQRDRWKTGGGGCGNNVKDRSTRQATEKGCMYKH